MKFNRKILGLIYDSCDGHCYYCGVHLAPFGSWQVDHMQPVKQGGEDAFYNLVAACRTCNASKGNRTVEEFRQIILDRAVKQISDARESLTRFKTRFLHELTPEYQKAVDLLAEAEDLIVNVDIIFYGQAACLSREDDALFSVEVQREMDGFVEEDDDTPLGQIN